MRDVLYVVIPAYNEQDTIGDVIKSWYNVVKEHDGEGKSRLVIINDGSKDDTYKIASELKKDYPLLEVIDKKNEGHGATVLYGYHYAIDNNADYIFQTDSDGQTDPNEFAEFWENRENYDMVIGHRKGREDGISRVFVTKTLKYVLKLVFHVDVTDANTPFRLMKKDTLAKYIGLIPDGFNLSNVILSVIYKKKNLKVKYIKITFRPRQGGVNSINLKKIFGIGVKALK
ncbi:MAG: glycosyltransferase family 2 protein, partial [Lachnospiraceae bacterium]|nr:glycosyltransferase family 2 protein [Lachnospiraceae bacterium]